MVLVIPASMNLPKRNVDEHFKPRHSSGMNNHCMATDFNSLPSVLTFIGLYMALDKADNYLFLEGPMILALCGTTQRVLFLHGAEPREYGWHQIWRFLNLQIAYVRIRDVSFLSRMYPLAHIRKRVIKESRPFPEKRDADEGLILPSSGMTVDGRDQREFWLLSQQ